MNVFGKVGNERAGCDEKGCIALPGRAITFQLEAQNSPATIIVIARRNELQGCLPELRVIKQLAGERGNFRPLLPLSSIVSLCPQWGASGVLEQHLRCVVQHTETRLMLFSCPQS